MDAVIQERLRSFGASVLDKAHLGPDDITWFCNFCIQVYRTGISTTGDEIRRYLYAEGFSADVALRLGLQFERYAHLLDQSDSGQSP
jgi:hypothetical protein